MTSEERLSAAVAAQVRGLLARYGMSGAALSRVSGVEQTVLARKIRGESPFTLDDLAKVCPALEVSVTDLILAAQEGARGPSTANQTTP